MVVLMHVGATCEPRHQVQLRMCAAAAEEAMYGLHAGRPPWAMGSRSAGRAGGRRSQTEQRPRGRSGPPCNLSWHPDRHAVDQSLIDKGVLRLPARLLPIRTGCWAGRRNRRCN